MATRTFRGVVVAAALIAMFASGLGALALVVAGQFEAFLLVAFGGGMAMALLMIATASRAHHLPPFHDAFTNDLVSLDPMNMAHVRVAGVGGIGLLIVTAVVALQYQLLTAALVSGIVGGILCAGVLIANRRDRRPPEAGVNLHS